MKGGCGQFVGHDLSITLGPRLCGMGVQELVAGYILLLYWGLGGGSVGGTSIESKAKSYGNGVVGEVAACPSVGAGS